MHPLHPISVHAPLACFLFTPLADAAALLTGDDVAWTIGALTTAGAVAFGVLAATLGALDFEKAHAKAPRTVISHLTAMATALIFAAASLSGRIGESMAIIAPPPAWALICGALAAASAIVGGYFGGDLVYRHGVNVQRNESGSGTSRT